MDKEKNKVDENINEKEFQLLKSIIKVRSVNSMGGGEIIDKVLNYLDSEGADYSYRILKFGNVKNLLLVAGSNEENEQTKTLVLNGHYDVVPSDREGWGTDPYEARIEDGFIYGRGTSDMKGPDMVMISAFSEYAKLPKEKRKNKIILMLVGEEENVGENGTKKVVETLLEEEMKIDAVLIGEPNGENEFGDRLKIGRRGTYRIKVEVKGKGGHGAVPHLAIDPVLTASQITVAVQSIVARNISPLDSAVISVCMIQTGTASNIIPDTALIKGTMRAFTPEIFETLSNRLVEVVEGIAKAMGCKVDVALGNPILPTTNNDTIAGLTKEAILEILPETTIDEHHQTMGSEDMSIWLDKIPGCFFFLGSANAEKGLNYSHHHPKFDFDETALPMGAASLASAAVKILESK